MGLRPPAAAIAVAVAVAVAVGACGDREEIITTASTGDAEQAQLAFAACMRQHGVEVTDPDDPSQPLRLRGSGEGTPARLEQLTKKCRDQSGGGGPRELSPEQLTELRDKGLKFARCMRENGVDMPDPGTSDGPILGRRGSGFDPASPRFEAAERACRALLPGSPPR